MKKFSCIVIDGQTLTTEAIDRFYRETVLGMTQSELSAITNVSQTLISTHERGIYSETAHDAYEQVGVSKFVDGLRRHYVSIRDVITGAYARRLHDDYPTLVPYKPKRWAGRF